MDLQFTTLYDLIDAHPDHFEFIKNQYCTLLSYLTAIEPFSDDIFLTQVMEISKTSVIVICYTDQLTIVATGTIFFEPKLIHGGRPVGHIEDVVVHPDYRSLGISTVLLHKLTALAVDRGCYKTILDCNADIVPVYKKAGFEMWGIQMAQYF